MHLSSGRPLAQFTGFLGIGTQRTKLLLATLGEMPLLRLPSGQRRTKGEVSIWQTALRGAHLAAPAQDVQLVQAA